MLTNKDYCDYDTCVALKELGYKIPTSAYYMPKNSQLIFVINQFRGGAAMDCFYSNNSLPKECMASDFIDAPTMWEVQKWLREEKDIIVYPEKNSFGWYYAIHYNVGEVHQLKYSEECDTYEESLSKGLREAVKILKEE